MCRSKMSIDAIQPTSPSKITKQPSTSTSTTNTNPSTTSTTVTATVSSSGSSRRSLASLRNSLPENPHLYNISEIRIATNNFLAKDSAFSSSSSTRCWRCSLHGKDVIIFQRKSQTQLTPRIVQRKLSFICRSHHVAIVNLLGASISGEYVYFVYDFVQGGNLYELLHNPKNPDFTILSSWMSRVQVASDLANGLDYIHNSTGLDITFVHNHVKSSSVIVTEPTFNAKLCHFGVSELCGEPTEERLDQSFRKNGEIVDDESEAPTTSFKRLNRSNSVKFSGTRGYMSPEFQSTGIGTRKSDVYSFGVVLIELLSGEEPVKYKLDKVTKEYRMISAVDAAIAVVENGDDQRAEREGRIRKWVDRRLKDSYPVDVAEKLTRLAVDCVHVDPDLRPDMRRVAGKISKLYLESKVWCDKMSVPTDFTVSFAPR
ncbi:hypothetical protein KSS87_015973 [Heliosperma pusillum]|nr:hypothetical protein KSS87_015973 [Heliosperma pusillum]